MKNYLIVDSEQFRYNTIDHVCDSHLGVVFEPNMYAHTFCKVSQKGFALKKMLHRYDFFCLADQSDLFLEDSKGNRIDLHVDEMCAHLQNKNSYMSWVAVANINQQEHLTWFYRSNTDGRFRNLFTHEVIANGEDIIVNHVLQISQVIKDVPLYYLLFNHRSTFIADVEKETVDRSIDICDYHTGTFRDMIFFPRFKKSYENDNIVIAPNNYFEVDIFERSGYIIKKRSFDFSCLPVKITTDLKYEQTGIGKYKFYVDKQLGFLNISIKTQSGVNQDPGIYIKKTYLVYGRKHADL